MAIATVSLTFMTVVSAGETQVSVMEKSESCRTILIIEDLDNVEIGNNRKDEVGVFSRTGVMMVRKVPDRNLRRE